MSDNQKMINERESRFRGYAPLMDVSKTEKEIAVEVDSIFGAFASANPDNKLVVLDSVVGNDTNSETSFMVDALASMIHTANQNGTLTLDAIDSAFASIAGVASSGVGVNLDAVNLDDVQAVSGSQILGSLAKTNAYNIISAPHNELVGNIGDAIPIRGSDNSVVNVLSQIPVAVKGMGDIATDTELNGVNSLENMSFASRESELASATGTLTYTFNLKILATDAGNYKMNRGTNEIAVGDVFMDDINVDSSSLTNVVSRTDANGIVYTATFDYANGTIVLVLSADIANATPIYFVGELDHKKLSEISGSVGHLISVKPYTAKVVVVETEVNSLDLRQTIKSAGINLISQGLALAYNKVKLDETGAVLRQIRKLAVTYGALVDLSTGTGKATTMEEFKPFMVRTEKIAEDILTTSQITSNIKIIGGSGVVDIIVNSAHNTDGKTKILRGSENSFRKIGYTNTGIPVFFDPSHDKAYPVVDGVNEHTAIVIGVAVDPTKNAVIVARPLPLLPVDLKINNDSIKTMSLQGKTTISANKETRPRKLVRKFTYKL